MIFAQLLLSIGSGNALSSNRRQAITWTNDGPVLWRTNFTSLLGCVATYSDWKIAWLTHLSLVPHVCVSELGQHWSSPVRRQVTTRTNAGLLLIGLLWTNYSEIRIGILLVSFKKNAFEIVVCQNGGHFVYGDELTHWGRHKMAAISQTTLSNDFSWMKRFEFRLRFHWSLFLRVQLTIS